MKFLLTVIAAFVGNVAPHLWHRTSRSFSLFRDSNGKGCCKKLLLLSNSRMRWSIQQKCCWCFYSSITWWLVPCKRDLSQQKQFSIMLLFIWRNKKRKTIKKWQFLGSQAHMDVRRMAVKSCPVVERRWPLVVVIRINATMVHFWNHPSSSIFSSFLFLADWFLSLIERRCFAVSPNSHLNLKLLQ